MKQWSKKQKAARRAKICSGFLLLFLLLLPSQQKVLAGTRDNAADFYNAYGNAAVFQADSSTDGNIYYGTKGVIASSGTRYQTIGWKVTVTDGSDSYLQTIYYALGGSYLHKTNTTRAGAYEYELYSMSLSTLKSRLSQTARTYLAAGNCRIVLDACMTTNNGSGPAGSMNDYGNFSGRVYTDYSGIVNAANWTSASRTELYSYFNKSVQGLFCSVSVSGDYGIAGTSGSGVYCYGSYVQVSASLRRGYLFTGWSNGRGETGFGFTVTNNTNLYARSKPMETVVTYYRNMEEGDSTRQNVTYTYDRGGQTFGQGIGWKWLGHHIEGFGRDKSTVVYTPGQGVSNSWILDYYPTTTLYTIWDINHYKIHYDGNGATGGSMEDEDYIYTDTMTLPENGFAKTDKPCTFVGWSLSPDSLREEYVVGEELPLADLAERTNHQYENATISLYAIWDYAPEIKAVDLYYSYEDGEKGNITPEEIARFVRCPDREDGVLSLSMEEEMGVDAEGLSVGYWYIEDYDASLWENAVEEAKAKDWDDTAVTLTLVAKDHAGNITKQNITVSLVDTTVHLGMDCYGRARIISSDYLYDGDKKSLRPEDTGGLDDKSVWRLADYLTLLQQVLGQEA